MNRHQTTLELVLRSQELFWENNHLLFHTVDVSRVMSTEMSYPNILTVYKIIMTVLWLGGCSDS